MPLLVPATFLKRLVPPEQADTEYLRFNENNSRNFLLLHLLIEVQKTGFALERWRKLAADEGLGQPRDTYDNNLRLTLESIADEQSLWQRKLTEGLVLLINFSLTNSAPHYYHFLLLLELKRQNRRINDQQRFFGTKNETAERTRNRIVTEIEKLERSIGDISTLWYRKPNKREVTSVETQLHHALTIAMPFEKRALGYTYGKGYGETSSSIHLSAVETDCLKPEMPFFAGFSICGLLAEAILSRAHALTGTQPEGINWHFDRTRHSVQETDPTRGTAQVGDFVLVDELLLGIVEEVATGQHGYESYRVKYIIDRPAEGIDSDWYSPFDITMFMDRKSLREGLNTWLGDVRKEGIPPLDLPPSEDEIDQALLHSAEEMWRRGIGEYVKRNVIQIWQDRGLQPLEVRDAAC